MKSLLEIATLSLGLSLLAGCASTQNTTYREAAPPTPGSMVVDQRYVAIVENVAKNRGTRVMWVNKPVKRVPATVATAE